MLTLKQIEAEAKRRGVELDDMSLTSRPNYDSKEYQDFRKNFLADCAEEAMQERKNYEQARLKAAEAHRIKEEARKKLKFNPETGKPIVFKPIPFKWDPFEPHEQPDEEAIEQEFDYEFGGDDQWPIEFEEDQSTFSCGVPEFGNFVMEKTLDKHWDLLLQYYVQTSSHKYFRCTVPVQKRYAALNNALKAVGFEQRAQCPSRMGKYKINVWEYRKK